MTENENDGYDSICVELQMSPILAGAYAALVMALASANYAFVPGWWSLLGCLVIGVAAFVGFAHTAKDAVKRTLRENWEYLRAPESTL